MSILQEVPLIYVQKLPLMQDSSSLSCSQTNDEDAPHVRAYKLLRVELYRYEANGGSLTRITPLLVVSSGSDIRQKWKRRDRRKLSDRSEEIVEKQWSLYGRKLCMKRKISKMMGKTTGK